MSHLLRKTVMMTLSGLCAVACATQAAKTTIETSKGTAAASPEAKAAEPARKTASTPIAPAEGCDWDPKMSNEQRRIAVSNAVIEAEKLIPLQTRAASDDLVRARIGTFAAGSVDDSVPFITVDRECWVDFYQAQNALIANNMKEAAEASDAWRVCLQANFPNRLPLAQPYFSCFENRK